ncbi:retrovirus-related Pol polyprotein from transposon 17.6 [Trichonephila clavipes]|nr:retrovirus-related Pol polyprotein from transposon 17.6 [Trichonephila clavipes]
MLSRPACHEENELCEVCTVAIDVPSRSPKKIRDEQMKNEELVKIISCLEDPDKNVNYVNWVANEDCTTKWVELFALPNATAEECAITLIVEVLLRHGLSRCLISDNGTQFVSAVMQQICYILNIHQSRIPVYHQQANPVERKNKNLKPQLAILVQDKHDCWSEKLPFIHFALNTAKCETTER